MAVATGQCTVAVAWRARKRADPASRPWAQAEARLADSGQWTRPFGILRPVDEIAMLMRRYMHEYGGTRDHLANVALAFRKHASMNPAATMGHKPMTREDYMDARWISEPLCLFDNCLETDGALAVVITSADRAVDTEQPPAWIHAFAQGLPPQHQTMTNYFTDDPLRGPGVDRGEAPVGQRRCRSRGRQGRAALRRVQPADPALARGLRLLRARRGRPVHRRRRDRGPRRPAAGEHERRGHVRGVRARLQPHPRRRAPDPRHVHVPGPERRRVARHERRRRPDVRAPVHEGTRRDGERLAAPRSLDEPTSAPFWEGTARGELLVQACGALRPPAHAAPPDVPALPVDRREVGRDERAAVAIWSYIVPHPPLLPAYSEFAPYNVIIVELDEDPLIRFVGNLVTDADGAINEIDPATITIGEPVRVVFAKVEDVFLPRWVRA